MFTLIFLVVICAAIVLVSLVAVVRSARERQIYFRSQQPSERQRGIPEEKLSTRQAPGDEREDR
ncbi:MAG: hypothetical protein KGR26_00030 [Cyanobacteria bacterium REEB65]|nr:hypothetical protein [Cyanobacteria bacterium REEB65]